MSVITKILAFAVAVGNDVKEHSVAIADLVLHKLSLSDATPTSLSNTPSAGTGLTAARSDHSHLLPSNASESVDGLMSKEDKTKLNTISNGTVVYQPDIGLVVSDNFPVDPVDGMTWLNVNDGITYLYVVDSNGFHWVEN